MRHCHKKLLKLANFNCFSTYIVLIQIKKHIKLHHGDMSTKMYKLKKNYCFSIIKCSLVTTNLYLINKHLRPISFKNRLKSSKETFSFNFSVSFNLD